jgi:hypothetical protein
MELEDNFFLLTAFLNHRAFLLSGSIPILRGGPLFRENTKLLNGEILYSLEEARIVIENWRKDYYKKKATFIFGLSAASTRKLSAAAPVCATQTSSAGRLRLGKHLCLKLTFNWTTFWGQINILDRPWFTFYRFTK